MHRRADDDLPPPFRRCPQLDAMTALQITLGTVGGIVGLALAAWPVAIA